MLRYLVFVASLILLNPTFEEVKTTGYCADPHVIKHQYV